MDGLTALSIATSAVRLIRLGLELLSDTCEPQAPVDGATKSYHDLRILSGRLEELCDDLGQARNLQKDQNRHDKAILKISQQCKSVGLKLTTTLEEVRTEGGNKWSSTLSALETLWTVKTVAGMVKCLETLQDDIRHHLKAALEDCRSVISKKLEDLSEKLKDVHWGHKDRLPILRRELLTALQESRENIVGGRPTFVVCSLTLDNLAIQATRTERETRFLQSLRFPEMRAGQPINQDLVDTFKWIYLPYYVDRPVHFYQWLESESCPFLIVGKAGSGKSTLFKAFDARMIEPLNFWKGGNHYVQCNQAFWNRGTDLQKSYQGLLRSILYQIYWSCPELIPEKFSDSGFLLALEQWSIEDLVAMIEDVGSRAHHDTRFCVFIDGVEEYCGDEGKVASALQTLSSNSAFKVCLSTRPGSIFEGALRTDERYKLILHEHTETQIRLYVRETLNQEPFFQDLRARNQPYQDIIERLVEKAQGVFLWVFLAIKNVSNNVPHKDSVKDTSARIDAFPPDLEDFFMHTLDSTPPAAQTLTSKLFLMLLTIDTALPFVTVYLALEMKSGWKEDTKCDSLFKWVSS